MIAHSPTQSSAPRNRFPAGLSLLLIVAGCGSLGYYALHGVLKFALMERAGFAGPEASAAYGIFTALMLLMPVAGGAVADRAGRLPAVLAGAVLGASGAIALALQLPLFLALGLIIVSSGLLRASVPALLGALYPGDAGRAGGFALLHIAINIGAFGSSFASSAFGSGARDLGGAFIASAIAYGLAGIIFASRLHRFSADEGQRDAGTALQLTYSRAVAVIVAAGVAAALAWMLLVRAVPGATAFMIAACLAVATSIALVARDARRSDAAELGTAGKRRLGVLAVLGLAVGVVGALQGASNTSADSVVASVDSGGLLGLKVAAVLGGVLLGALAVWAWWRTRFVSSALGIGVALLLGGIGSLASVGGLCGEIAAFAALPLSLLGGIALTALGFTAVSRLAPPRHMALAMGSWGLVAPLGNMAAAPLAMTLPALSLALVGLVASALLVALARRLSVWERP